MIDEKTLPPPDRTVDAASPPPAYPESSTRQLSPTLSSVSSPSATTSAPTHYLPQTSPHLPQSPPQAQTRQPSFQPPMGAPPDPMMPLPQTTEIPPYQQGYPYPPQTPQAQQPKTEGILVPSQDPLHMMQMDAQIGAQFQQQLFARCARGDHDVETKHGVCGIITAVILFPVGLICLFMDVEKKCTRCGTIVG